MNRTTAFFGAVAATLAALMVAWFLFNFERVEEEIEVGPQGAARSNAFLAAERLFTRLGSPARTLPAGLSTLPPPDHALVLVSPERSLSAETFEEVLAWVRQGGRLLVVPDRAPSLDPILRHWEVDVVENPDAGGPEVLEVPLREGVKAKAEMPQDRRLIIANEKTKSRLGTKAGLAFVRYDEGEGSVTFLSDDLFLSNDSIGLHDHATLAWALVRAGGDPPAGVWLAVRDQVPTLRQLLVRHAWMALASGALLIAAWLWTAGARFGPTLPEPPHHRRSLLEHIEASGEFLWLSGRGDELVLGARQTLLHRIEVRQPGWSKLPPADLVQRLSTSLGVAPAQIDQALHGAVTDQAPELVHALRTLEMIRRSL